MTDLSVPILIEGYAALFGIPDLSGDVVRAGAFARTLRSGAPLAMLLQHRQGALAGRWTRVVEDGRGLFVRGLIERHSAGSLALRGLNGLSIGFRPRLWKPRTGGGRDLIEVDLVEISLVATPMQPQARFTAPGMDRNVA
ncbi:MAG: HK97 family phage prohead protease [Hyphomonas sp.]|uniref:HK97 family phage prohead protease n=1 Tax=Hyphomonas sp. TaxID=87 RepID=UPI00352880C8